MTDYAPRITREGEFSPLVLGKLGETFRPRKEYPTPSAQENLPPYAGIRTHGWVPPVYYPESLVLTSLREVVARGLGGTQQEIVFIGDSKTEGSGLTGSQAGVVDQWSFPAQVRRMLGASEGLIIANVTAGDSRWTVSNMTRSTPSRCCVTPSSPGTPAQNKMAQVLTTEAHTAVRVYARAVAGATCTVTIDGVATSWVIAAGASWAGRRFPGLSNTVHTIKIESTDDFDLLGVKPEYPTPRLLITRAGRSSSSATDWNAQTADGLWASTVSGAATKPTALVINLGTNDPSNATAIASIYARAAALNIPVLNISPGGLGGLASYATYDVAKDAIYDAADTYGFPLIDFENVIGDYTAANSLSLMGDTVHENANGYALEAMAVVQLIATAGTSVSSTMVYPIVHLENGVWIWDPVTATHYVVPDNTGAFVVRESPQPIPSTTPALNW